MKRTLFNCFCVTALLGFFTLFNSCVSTPDINSSETPDEVVTEKETVTESEPVPEKPVVSLYVPEKIERVFFSFNDESIMHDLEIGSPNALNSAALKLKKSASNYTEPEAVALSVASSIMSMVWPYQKNTIEVPDYPINANPYTASIESAKIGIYDENTGNSDFFTLVLPSLIVVTSYSNEDYYPLSETALKAALELNKKSVLANYLLGRLYLRMNRIEDAVKIFETTIKLAPEIFEVNYHLANTLFITGRIQEAQKITDSMSARFPKNLTLLKLCTEISLAKKDYIAAEQYIAQVLQQEPDNLRYLLYRIKVLVEQENYIKAVPLLDVYARSDKSSKEYLLLRSKIQYDWNKNSAAAFATIEEAMMLYPDDFDIILAAAELASETGSIVRGKTAGQFAREILLVSPDNIKALEICKKDAIQQRDWQNAYEYSRDLLRLENNADNLVLAHINICLNLNKVSEAQSLANSYYADFPDSDDAKEMYIRCLVASGNKTEALNMITKLLSGASPKLKSYLYYQRSLFAQTDAEKLADLRQSLTAVPRNQEPLFELYRYYFEKKDYRKAQYYLKQVVALNPNDQYILGLNAELDKYF
ncbi:MAG: tetratricopeptide repeat protein [Spirochaetaceae bacterium]|nr:tetratricopeptide repeat protein [Spirochaetaceae bacterium]